MKLIVTISLAALFLNSCASIPPSVDVAITPFHDFSYLNKLDMKIYIQPSRSELKDSLEFKTYKNKIAGKLLSQGFNVVEDSPTHILYVDYGIDNGRNVTSTYSIPQFGVTGYSGSTTTGTVRAIGNTAYINTTTTNSPQYGITGYNQGVYNTTVYSRYVNVDLVQFINNKELGAKIYESRLKSSGSCGNFTALAPLFIDALFTNFPGENGVQQKYTMPWNGEC